MCLCVCGSVEFAELFVIFSAALEFSLDWVEICPEHPRNPKDHFQYS